MMSIQWTDGSDYDLNEIDLNNVFNNKIDGINTSIAYKQHSQYIKNSKIQQILVKMLI